MDFLISIIVPVYNVAEYLTQCIESIINQTYKNLQVILVNDGSTDQSGKICDNYVKRDTRIQVIHQKNSGLVRARKAGLAIAKGEYIGFVDSDDYIDSNMFEALLSKVLEEEADFVHSGYMLENQVVNVVRERRLELSKINRGKFLKEEILEGGKISYSIWSKLFRAELIKKVYLRVPDECSYGEDMLCLCGCIMESNSLFLYSSAFYHYRVRNESLSHLDVVNLCVRESLLYLGVCDLLKQYAIYDECKESLEQYYKRRLYNAITYDLKTGMKLEQYSFENISCLQGRKIVIYGAGIVGRGYYSQISMYTNCRIIAWVDKNYLQYDSEWIQVMSPDKLPELEFDLLLIAVKSDRVAEQIREELIVGVPGIEAKIIWEKPVRVW